MKVYAPDYYADFHCLAGGCRHTCCQGWEIDIDEESLKRYRAMRGPFGRRIRACISEEDTPHFMLREGERCPLLNGDNLCELILQRGEEALCQICADHPRFRNYWSDRVEMGLGLACEEAARLILSSDHPLRLVEFGEEEGGEVPLTEGEIWLRELRERLLARISETGPAARLREYMIYRHLADALYDGRPEARLRFVDRACGAILSGWDQKNLPDLAERARQFSNEIEYDDEKLREMME